MYSLMTLILFGEITGMFDRIKVKFNAVFCPNADFLCILLPGFAHIPTFSLILSLLN